MGQEVAVMDVGGTSIKTGAVRFDDGDFTVVADLPKRVDWDQGRLADMVARIEEAGDDPSEYVDLAF